MFGIIVSLISGIAMSVQGVFNTNISEKVGLWEANSIVQAIGLVCALIVTFTIGKGDIRNIKEVNKFYLLGGVLAAVITYTVMKGISLLGTTFAISLILVAQLVTAALIDNFGLFGTDTVKFGIRQFVGAAVMIAGIIIFKWKAK